MKRRELMLLLGGAMTLTSALYAQREMRVVGYLGARSSGESASLVASLLQGMNETGYVEGKDLTIEYRWAEGHYDRLPALAADLVARKVDVIVAQSDASALAAKRTTSTLPIVFIAGNPVGAGLVASLARPGGNLTGVSLLTTGLMAKRLELISELVPRGRVMALIVNPNNPATERQTRDAQEAAHAKGIQLHTLNAGTSSEIDTAFASLAQLQASALVVGADAFFTAQREQLVALALHHAVPAIFALREFVASGGLISYAASLTSVYRQAGIYAGNIINGAKPADLPVEQPTKFELVINMKTAQALGLTVPQSVLIRADEVIE